VLYRRFSPSNAQYNALRGWLTRNGFLVTQLGHARLIQRLTVKPFVFFVGRAQLFNFSSGIAQLLGATNVSHEKCQTSEDGVWTWAKTPSVAVPAP